MTDRTRARTWLGSDEGWPLAVLASTTPPRPVKRSINRSWLARLCSALILNEGMTLGEGEDRAIESIREFLRSDDDKGAAVLC